MSNLTVAGAMGVMSTIGRDGLPKAKNSAL